jgi:hypothetical protein
MINRKDKNEMVFWAVNNNATEILKHFLTLGIDAVTLEEAAKLTSNREMLSIISLELRRLKNDSNL